MCFSAEASFGAGIMLSTIGVITLRNSQHTSQNLFASIPLIFGAQQVCEGVLWLALSNPAYVALQWPATHIFLFFAQVVWPFWVPFSISRLSCGSRSIKTEKALVAIGALVSIYLAYCLLKYNVEAKIIGKHISYIQQYPKELSRYGGILYIITTIAPPFFSRAKWMWSLGASILISYFITTIFYEEYIVSVWCFFAAIVSGTVYVIVRELNKNIAK
jgi:hypothetical protein